MCREAFPNHPATADQADDQVHDERLHGAATDDLEHLLRRKAADPDRVLAGIDCVGRPCGKPVACRLAGSPAG